MIERVGMFAVALLAAPSVGAQVNRIPPNAIDRATAADDARRASISDLAATNRDRATREARIAPADSGPLPQSTMTDRVDGANGSVAPLAAVVTSPPNPN